KPALTDPTPATAQADRRRDISATSPALQARRRALSWLCPTGPATNRSWPGQRRLSSSEPWVGSIHCAGRLACLIASRTWRMLLGGGRGGDGTCISVGRLSRPRVGAASLPARRACPPEPFGDVAKPPPARFPAAMRQAALEPVRMVCEMDALA